MAKETIQEAYAKGIAQLKELERLYSKSSKKGQVRRDLINEITELRVQLTFVKKHLLKVEALEYKASEQWKTVSMAIERATNIRQAFANYEILKSSGGDKEDIAKLRQNLIENLAFVDPKYADLVDDKEILTASHTAILDSMKLNEDFLNTLDELNEANAPIKTDVFVDDFRIDADERIAKIVEEKQREAEINKTLSDVEQFKKIVAERNSNWQRICNLKGVSLNGGKYSNSPKRSVRDLQEDIKAREKFIKDFIYEFSKNPNYEINDELKSLIGTREESIGGVKGTTFQKPTVKQHLEPILEIEEKLKSGVSQEEEKELKDKKEKLEKRLGKKWLLKLKIDRISSRIKELNKLLKGDISPEERKKYQEELSQLKGELGVLQKEYGEVLTEIADNVSKIVEKAENKRKSKSDLNKDKSGDDAPKSNGTVKPKNKDEKKKEPDKKNENKPKTNERKTTVTPEKSDSNFNGNGVQTTRNGNVVPFENTNTINSSNTKNNLPAVKGESWLKKLKSKFESKEEPVKEKVKPEVLFSIEVDEDAVNQKLGMFANHRIPQVRGKYFYHIVREGDELQYIREPLTNIDCSKKELLKKIKEVQEKYVEYYKGLYGEQKGNPLLENPNSIARRLIGFSNGLEKRQRILKTICSLESAIHPQEAIDVLNGKDTMPFRPGLNGKGEYVDIISTGYLDEGSALAQYAGKVKYRSNEALKEMRRVAEEDIKFLEEYVKNIEEKRGAIDMQEKFEKMEKIREGLGAITNEQKDEALVPEDKIVSFSNAKERLDDGERLTYRRGRSEPRDLMSDETRKRRNARGMPTVKSVTTIDEYRKSKPWPVFNRHPDNPKSKNNDAAER